MNLLILAALVAVCSAAKLDRTYLPPASAKTAGGSPGAIQAPNSLSQNSAPKGSYTNEFQGVVVDAALAGTRASGSEETGLGAPRNSYGSTASKVGDAAFRVAPLAPLTQAGFRFPVSTQDDFGSANSQFGVSRDSTPAQAQFGEAREVPARTQGFGGFDARDRPERPQAAQERTASTLRFDSEVGAESFNYAFETDNGISAEETGVATNGVQAQGGFSYTGDDGKVYSITYTADEGGYQPRGDHLPTPPPIPEEILKSLEQNARDEANGVIDDGLYDAQKYNAGSDYAESDSANGKLNGRPSVNTGNTDVDASGTFINQNNVPFNPNNPRQRGDDKTVNQFQVSSGAGNSFNSNAASSSRFGSRNEYLPPFQQNRQQNSRPQIPEYNSDADSSSTFQQESTQQTAGFQSHSQENQHSLTRPNSQSFGSRPTSNNQFNSFKQSSSNGNQFNQNRNRFPSSQGNRQQFGAAPVSSHSEHNQFSAQASASLSSQHSTSIPDTELTTPFESSPQDAQPSAPTSFNTFGFNAQSSRNEQSQFGSPNSHHLASQAPVQPTIPSFAQSRPQNSNSRPLSGNRNTQSSFSTQAPQVPQQQEQFAQQSQFGNKRPQFTQNRFSPTVDNQFAPSTAKPLFAQQATAQDESYYYNQPSRAFNTPQTQGARFPSAPSNQFDRVTQRPSFSSQTTQYPEEQNYPSTPFPSRNGQRQGSSRYPSSPSSATESTPSDNQFQSNAVASATNGITQASASSFAAPTSATGFNRQQFGQNRQQFQQSSFQSNQPTAPEASKPSFAAQTTAQPQDSRGQNQFEKQNFESAQPLSQQPLQDVKQPKLDDDTKPDVPVTNQQYNGEIYEYTKPAEMLPPPENGFGQFGQKMPSKQQPTQSRPQFEPTASAQQTTSGFASQSQSAQFSQTANTQQGNQFGSRPQFSQTTQTEQSSFVSKPQFGQNGKAPQSDQFEAQTASQEQSVNAQIDAKPSRQQFSQSVQGHSQQQSNQFNSQRRPFAQSQASFADAAETPQPFSQNGRNCCKSQFGQTQSSFGQGRRPSQFSGESSFGTNFKSNSGFKADQSQSVAGKGEVFGGPRAPPSFDETGYHY